MVGGGTGSLSAAGETAGVHTSVVDDLANLVTIAVSVGLTLNLGASKGGAGITDMLLVTLAERLVVLHQTVGVGPTVCSVAGVDTFPVSAAVSGAGKSIQAVAVGPALVGALAALGVGVSHLSTGAGALEGAGGVCAGGGSMTHLVFTLVDIFAAIGRADEARGTYTVASLAYFPGPAVLLLVAAGLARGVEADLALETVLVGVADLHTDVRQALLSLGTVGVDATLPMAHAAPAGVLGRAGATGAAGGDPHTALLRGGDPSKPWWAGTLHILVENLAKSIGAACTLLSAGVDTLEADADFIRRTVAVAPAANGADSVAADLAGGTLLAGDAGDHTHALAALLSHKAVALTAARDPALAGLAGGPSGAVTVTPATLAVSDTCAGVQGARDETVQTLTLCISVGNSAFSVWSTSIKTLVLALAVDTETCCSGTVFVAMRAASFWEASTLIGVSHITPGARAGVSCAG